MLGMRNQCSEFEHAGPCSEDEESGGHIMVALDLDRNPEISLTAFLARRARTSTDARLIVDAVIGFVVALASLLAHGPIWHLFTSAGICFLSFGAWGIADRELGERVVGTRVARMLA